MVSRASAEFHALVEQELNQERAGALGRAGRRLAAAIADCATARAEREDAASKGDPAGVRATTDAYDQAFDRYQRAHRDFCIQREANRLRDHSLVDRFYPPPARPTELDDDPGTTGGSRNERP